jgi:hypothetical protein
VASSYASVVELLSSQLDALISLPSTPTSSEKETQKSLLKFEAAQKIEWVTEVRRMDDDAEAIQRQIRKGAKNSLRKLDESDFGMRQLAGARMANCRAFAAGKPDAKYDLTEQPRTRIPIQRKILVALLVVLVLIWYARLVYRSMFTEDN